MATLPFDLEIEDLAEIAAIMKKNDLGELRFTDDEIGSKLIIKSRQLPPPPQTPPGLPPQMLTPLGTGAAPASVQGVSAPSADSDSSEGTVIKAPIVGTYYASPAPGKPPFVTVGQKVRKGDVIMIIETMKLMNEIQSDVDGVVSKILVKDGQAVEYDQPVMIIGQE